MSWWNELWLKIVPVVLGAGKRLFGDGAAPRSFKLKEWKSTAAGVIVLDYGKDGEVKTGPYE